MEVGVFGVAVLIAATLVVEVFAGGFVGAECFAALAAGDLGAALVEAAFGAATFAAAVLVVFVVVVGFDAAVLDA